MMTTQPVLTDPAVRPSDAAVREHLGRTAPLWDALFERIDGEFPHLDREWRFYRDGGSWLMKVTHGKRTICWISVIAGDFRLTIYLPARAEPQVIASRLRDDLEQQFRDSSSDRTRGMTVSFDREDDVEAALALMALRDHFR